MGRMTNEAKKREELATRVDQGLNPTQRLVSQFDKAWPRIAKSASNAVSRDRMYQLILSTINRNPKLAECTPETVLSCFMRCTVLGLEPSDVDGLGRAYILPFYNGKKKHMEATFIIGYKGLIDLARRSGKIKDISARAVYDGDEFAFEYGLNETLRHVPKATDRTPEKLTHVYCVVHFVDGGHYIDVMTRSEIEGVRKRSKAANSGPWVTDYEAMAKKSVIRRSAPYLPLATQMLKAVASDETDGGFMDVITTAPLVEESDGKGEGLPVEIEVQGEPVLEQEIQHEASSDDVTTVFAACQNCGNVREVSPDLTQEQLDSFLCCEHPDCKYI